MLTTVDPSVRGRTEDAVVVGHLVLMNSVDVENARSVPSVSISHCNQDTVKKTVEEVKSKFGSGDMHVTIVKDNEALKNVKDNVDRMRSGLSSASLDDHVVIWSGSVPTLSQKQTTVGLAYAGANACTVLPMGMGPNNSIQRTHPSSRSMGSFAFVYPIDNQSDSWILSWWLWVFVFILSFVLIISFSIRAGKGKEKELKQNVFDLSEYEKLSPAAVQALQSLNK
jgi:hypothetical protein